MIDMLTADAEYCDLELTPAMADPRVIEQIVRGYRELLNYAIEIKNHSERAKIESRLVALGVQP